MLRAAPLLLLGCTSPDHPGLLVPETTATDPDLPQIALDIAGVRRTVHLEAHGDPADPVLLVLHGSLSDFRALRPFAELEGYRVVLWDQRGNGLSERIEAEEYSARTLVDEIDAVRAHFAEDAPVSLLGHSFGATYAALYASRHPERVERLVLLEPAGLTGAIFAESLPELVNIDLFAVGLNEQFWSAEMVAATSHEAWDYRARMLLLDAHQTNYHCDPDDPEPYPVWRPGAYVEHIRPERVLGYDGERFDYDFATGLDTFPGRVLLLAGECSALGPDFQRTWHLPLFAEAELVAVPDAGHRLFAEDWPTTRDAVQGFLDAP